jgi:hypothetical protein
MRVHPRAALAAVTFTIAFAISGSLVAPAPAHATSPGAVAPSAPLTNLSHLDDLTTQVSPPAQPGHTTYRLDAEPGVGVLWTYAEPDGSGGWKLVGGGAYHPETDTWGQGAFNADDMARAAVVYLRHWRATGATSSRDHARALLRGLTYLQTATGPNAGNVVLWMQPDGTLNPSADPKDSPDPSDSDASYWLARTIWALGEGYAGFAHADPAFAAFLRDRLDLAIGALRRQVLVRYGEHLDIDGRPAPAWLISDGADASSEAVLGLAAYVRAGGPASARTALRQLSRGIAEMSDGDSRTWPYGAIRPWAQSRSMWHGWGAQMPGALASASRVLGSRRLAAVAARDSFSFDPWMLTSGGPDNGRLPTRIDRSQIAYGADARLESLLAVGGRAGRRLAGLAGAWFFGANPAGVAMYDPATGVTRDGINGDGTVNPNSGAESTIHGLLAMLALDAHPRVAAAATGWTSIAERVGTVVVKGEQGTLAGAASAVQPASLWTGESQFSGTGYAALGDGGSATLALPEHPRSLVLPVVDLEHGSSAVTTFSAGGRSLGRVRSGAVGAQGDSPAPGALLPTTLPGVVGAGTGTLVASTSASGSDTARLDAVMLEPVVSRLVLAGPGGATALLSSRSRHAEHTVVDVAGDGRASVESYDKRGRLVRSTTSRAAHVRVVVPPGGFAVVTR